MDRKNHLIRRMSCILLLLLCMTVISACKETSPQAPETPTTQLTEEQVSETPVTQLTETHVSEIARLAPMFLQIGYQSTERLVLYGSRLLAVYTFDAEAETYVFLEAVDLTPLDIALMENAFVGTACFRENDVLLSPAHEGVSSANEPVYQYTYGSGVLRTLDISGETISGLRWEEAFQPLPYTDAPFVETLSGRLPEQSARLFSDMGILQKNDDGNHPLTRMEYGFFALNDQDQLVYGVSDAAAETIRLFPIFGS